MNTRTMSIASIDRRALLSTLWVVVMLNMLAADILTLHIPGALEELAAFAGETPVTQLMLVGAVVMEIAIAMVFLSRLLNYRVNRWTNIAAGVITAAYVVGGGSPYPHYVFLATVEVVCMLLIIWYAWSWRSPQT